MTRTLNATVNSYLARPSIRLLTLSEFDLDSGTVRFHNGAGWLTIGANTYGGIGDLASIEAINEDIESFSRGLRVTIGAVTSSTMLQEAAQENYFNRELRLFRAYYDADTLALVSTPELWFKGRVNQVNYFRGDQQRGDRLELILRTRLARELKASYYTKEDLWLTYSGDTFFNYLDQIANSVAYWGGKKTYFAVNGTSGNWGGGGGTSPGIQPIRDLDQF